MPAGSTPVRSPSAGCPRVLQAAFVLFACAYPDPPQRAPAASPPPQKPATISAAVSTWTPRPDPRAGAELAALEARARELVQTFNELDEGDERGPSLLAEAAAVCEDAGRLGHAIKLREHLRTIDPPPAGAEAENAARHVRSLYLRVLSESDAASTLHARACGATIIDPPSEASATALLVVAACVDEDPLLFMVSLRYRRIAAERGAGPDNDAKIQAYEDRRAKIQESLYRLAAAAPSD